MKTDLPPILGELDEPQTDRTALALSCFNNGFNCAQAVLSAFGPSLGLDREAALRVAGAFGAGMGRLGGTCGAVTGAMMVLGLKYGKTRPEDNDTRDKCYQLVQELMKRFESSSGTLVCRELLDCDLSTPEGYRFALDHKLFKLVCPKFVRAAVEITEDLL